MVAVEAYLILNEIATGERTTPGQNEAVDVPGLVEHVGREVCE